MKPPETDFYLHLDDSIIYPAVLIDRMTDGAKMLIQHIVNNDNIFIQVD